MVAYPNQKHLIMGTTVQKHWHELLERQSLFEKHQITDAKVGLGNTEKHVMQWGETFYGHIRNLYNKD